MILSFKELTFNAILSNVFQHIAHCVSLSIVRKLVRHFRIVYQVALVVGRGKGLVPLDHHSMKLGRP